MKLYGLCCHNVTIFEYLRCCKCNLNFDCRCCTTPISDFSFFHFNMKFKGKIWYELKDGYLKPICKLIHLSDLMKYFHMNQCFFHFKWHHKCWNKRLNRHFVDLSSFNLNMICLVSSCWLIFQLWNLMNNNIWFY